MKNSRSFVVIFLLALLALSNTLFGDDTNFLATKATQWPFYVYTESFSRANHFVSSGWMGDTGDMRFSDKWITDPKSGKYCIRIEYSGKRSQGNGWAGIFWQEPAMNWGNMKGGFDLTGAKTIVIWAKGEKGEEYTEFKIGGIKGNLNRDSTSASTGLISLTAGWKRYMIDISYNDMSTVIGGFCVVFEKKSNPNGATIFIDEIAYSTNTIEDLKKMDIAALSNK